MLWHEDTGRERMTWADWAAALLFLGVCLGMLTGALWQFWVLAITTLQRSLPFMP